MTTGIFPSLGPLSLPYQETAGLQHFLHQALSEKTLKILTAGCPMSPAVN